jgi:hypothetical protein
MSRRGSLAPLREANFRRYFLARFVNTLGGMMAAFFVGVRIPPRAVRTGAQAGTLAELREGWEFFRRTTWLWVVVLAFGFPNAIQTGAMSTLGP